MLLTMCGKKRLFEAGRLFELKGKLLTNGNADDAEMTASAAVAKETLNEHEMILNWTC